MKLLGSAYALAPAAAVAIKSDAIWDVGSNSVRPEDYTEVQALMWLYGVPLSFILYRERAVFQVRRNNEYWRDCKKKLLAFLHGSIPDLMEYESVLYSSERP